MLPNGWLARTVCWTITSQWWVACALGSCKGLVKEYILAHLFAEHWLIILFYDVVSFLNTLIDNYLLQVKVPLLVTTSTTEYKAELSLNFPGGEG